MMKRLIGLSIVFLAMMAICTPALLAQEEREATTGEENKILTLEHIKANPDSMKSTVIMFRGQFHCFNELYSPFYTPFNSTTHLNFSAWEYDAPLWVKEVFKRDFPYLYVDKKDKALCEKIMNYKTYMRFEATATIRSTFNNIPWIQVTSIKEMPRQLSRSTLSHMARGYHYLGKEKHLSAVLEFSQAYGDNVPTSVQALIRKEEGKALFKIGSYEEATEVLEQATQLLEDMKSEDAEVEFLLKESIAMTAYEERLAEEAEEWEDNRPEPAPVWEDEEDAEEAEEIEEEILDEPLPEEEKWIEEGEVVIEEAEEIIEPEPEPEVEEIEEVIEYEEIGDDEVLEEIDG